jgi:hypothetical protein
VVAQLVTWLQHAPVCERPAERVMRPDCDILRLHRNDVHVADEQRRQLCCIAALPRDQATEATLAGLGAKHGQNYSAAD